MSWPEKETWDEYIARLKRKVAAKQEAQARAIDSPPPLWPLRRRARSERTERPDVRRGPLPPEITRFPSDEELDKMWGK